MDDGFEKPPGMPYGFAAGEFFDVLFTGLDDGWVALRTWEGGNFGSSRGPTQTHWFAWPAHRDRIVGFVLTNQNTDIYVTPALFETRQNCQASNIKAQVAVYADADEMPLEAVRVPATMTVETSPGRHHMYWIVSDCTDHKRLALISKRIAHVHRNEGCDVGGWDSGQLLRVPGSRNNKPHANRFIVKGWTSSGVLYPVEGLESVYVPMTESTAEVPDLGTMPSMSDWPDEVEMNDLMQQHPDLARMYAMRLNRGEGGQEGRSGWMYAFLSEMRRQGFDAQTMLAAGWYSGINKYRQDGRTPEEFWREVSKAWHDPENTPVANAWEIEDLYSKRVEEKENPKVVEERRNNLLSFLSREELRNVPFDTFIDNYVAWTRSMTDAVPQYQRAGALTILSSVFGEFGRAPAKFHLPLNLWFMVMGPSTRSRKTTAMRIMTGFLDSLSDGAYQYVLGDDASPEALAQRLSERPEGITSLYYRDELHGLLVEESNKKYMAGFQPLLTQLYDGYNRSRMRIGSKESPGKNNAVNFPVYGTGVFKDTAHHLKEEDFASGHLARFIYVLGEPAEMSPETEWMDQVKEKWDAVDLERQKLLEDLREARDYWENLTKRGQTVPIKFHPCGCEAMCTYQTCQCADCPWRRWNQFAFDMKQEAKNYDMQEVLEATADRLGKSAMKVACLLAMADKKPYVYMRHILKAIHLAAEWFQHMILVANRVKATEWMKRQDDIADKVMTKGNRGITRNELYRAFRNYLNVGEFDDVLRALVLSGTLHRHEGMISKVSGQSSRVERYYWPDSCDRCRSAIIE